MGCFLELLVVVSLLDVEGGVFPELFVSDERIEDGEQFVPGGDEGEFLVLTPEDELLVAVFDDGVESDGAECGHGECGAHGGSSAPEGLCASKGSTVTVDGGDPDEHGDLLP